jgi:hypothetical protein
MTLADLQPFCGTEPTRLALHQPFPVNGYTYATDARILIRVPFIPGTPEIEGHPKNPDEVIPEKLDGYIPVELPPGWQDIPEKTTPCEHCKTTGKLTYTMRQCPDCDGDGTVECDHCHHEADCETCRGSGEVRTSAPKGGAPCPECNGKGHIAHTSWVSLNRGLCFVNLHYLKLAHTLPNLRILVLDWQSGLRLDFDGGIGALMPGRPGESERLHLTSTQWPD